MRIVDLRSDTVTVPTAKMRHAMANAEVGDDVLGEDPTVRKLEQRAADLLGKEDGLFVVSGTMANQIAATTFCRHGAEVVVAETSHIFNLEVAGLAALFGLQPRALPSIRGVFDCGQLSQSIRSASIQQAATGLVCLENSFDLNRGYAVPIEAINQMAALAHSKNVPVYLDGARIFNAAHALSQPASRIASSVDAAMFCLSKGLACPVGSVLAGSREFIKEARWNRQRQGGGWRQAGIIAAAGLVALDEMIDRLVEDNQRARRLATRLEEIGFPITRADVDTNIVHLEMPAGVRPSVFAIEMGRRGVKVKLITDSAVRIVIHKDIQEADAEFVIQSAAASLKESESLGPVIITDIA